MLATSGGYLAGAWEGLFGPVRGCSMRWLPVAWCVDCSLRSIGDAPCGSAGSPRGICDTWWVCSLPMCVGNDAYCWLEMGPGLAVSATLGDKYLLPVFIGT